MTAKGRIFGLLMFLFALVVMQYAVQRSNLLFGIAAFIMILMGLGKMKGY